ncbi:MAG: hypothetical protein QOH91_1542, partial [Mycobacterium sp.]|nr:hypothetical protein [Mycobacterium sp.]
PKVKTESRDTDEQPAPSRDEAGGDESYKSTTDAEAARHNHRAAST